MYSKKTRGKNEYNVLLTNEIKNADGENVVLHPDMSGVTTEKCVPLPLATMTGAIEVSLETT